MGKSPCFEKLHMKKEIWTDDQNNAKRLAYMPKHGTELGKYGKSCRLRRTDHLKQRVEQESFTQQEEELIIKLHAAIGSRWTIIAQQLPGRTENDVKNFWNTKLRKKLSAMGIDPVTHRPFSQILADYGNIGAIPKARTRFGSLSKNIKTSFLLRSENSQILSERESGFSSDFGAAGTTTSRVEPPMDSLLSNAYDSSANNQSHDLLTQLQAIKLVTEASSYTRHEFMPMSLITDCSSISAPSSSSPESPSTSTNQATTSPVFNWSDFLLEDAFPQANAQEQVILVSSPADMNLGVNQEYLVPAEEEEIIQANINVDASLPSSRSFVEAILESEHEMHLDFQGILEDPFYY